MCLRQRRVSPVLDAHWPAFLRCRPAQTGASSGGSGRRAVLPMVRGSSTGAAGASPAAWCGSGPSPLRPPLPGAPPAADHPVPVGPLGLGVRRLVAYVDAIRRPVAGDPVLLALTAEVPSPPGRAASSRSVPAASTASGAGLGRRHGPADGRLDRRPGRAGRGLPLLAQSPAPTTRSARRVPAPANSCARKPAAQPRHVERSRRVGSAPAGNYGSMAVAGVSTAVSGISAGG